MAVFSSGILRDNVREELARAEVVASITVRLVGGIEMARSGKRYRPCLSAGQGRRARR
jgi:hypothetical protein